jgi:hypothetical protein
MISRHTLGRYEYQHLNGQIGIPSLAHSHRHRALAQAGLRVVGAPGGGGEGRGVVMGWFRGGGHPLRGLAGDGCDVVVVAVVVQDGEVFSFGYCGDEQVGEADCPDGAAAPEGCLDVECAPHTHMNTRQQPPGSHQGNAARMPPRAHSSQVTPAATQNAQPWMISVSL